MGGSCTAYAPLVFCPLLNKYTINPYLKFLDFSKLFVADTPIINNPKFSFTPSQNTFGTPGTEIILIYWFYSFNKKILQILVLIIFRYRGFVWYHFQYGLWVDKIMVIILEGNTEHVAHTWRKLGIFGEKNDLWLLSI